MSGSGSGVVVIVRLEIPAAVRMLVRPALMLREIVVVFSGIAAGDLGVRMLVQMFVRVGVAVLVAVRDLAVAMHVGMHVRMLMGVAVPVLAAGRHRVGTPALRPEALSHERAGGDIRHGRQCDGAVAVRR